jgi:transcriptional regulator with XRE-family HTH domain
MDVTALRDNFRENVRRIMREQNLSQRDLARLLGISDPAVSQLLNGDSTPTLATVEAVAKVLRANNFALLIPVAEEVVSAEDFIPA